MPMGKASRQKKHSPLEPDKKVSRVAASDSSTIQWWLLAALCVVAFLAFAQTLSFDFVYDDDSQVLRNPCLSCAHYCLAYGRC